MGPGSVARTTGAGASRSFFPLLMDGLREHWRSVVGLVGLLVAFLLFILALGAAGIVNLGFVQESWGTFRSPAVVSLVLTTAAFGIGFLAAVPLGLVRAYGPRYFRRRIRRNVGRPEAPAAEASTVGRGVGRKSLIAAAYGFTTAYVEAVRGTPFFVQMYLVFYFMTSKWPHLWEVYALVGLTVLTLNTAGYQSELLRAGFQSVGQNQIDAAKALGMRPYEVFLHVTLPQSLRLVVLPLVNEWISLFKASAILAYISVQELYFNASQIGSTHPIEGFIMVAVVYVGIIVPLSRIVTYVERKRRIPGLGTPVEVRVRRRRPAAA